MTTTQRRHREGAFGVACPTATSVTYADAMYYIASFTQSGEA